MRVPATVLTARDEHQLTVIVIVDPLPTTLGVTEGTRVFELHDHTVLGAVDRFQQVTKSFHRDNVGFVVAYINCEIRQCFMAILGTCAGALVLP